MIFDYLNQSEDPVVAVKLGVASGTVLYLNDACCGALGCARDDVIDRPVCQMLDVELSSWITQIATHKGPQERKKARIGPNPISGKMTFADVTVVVTQDHDGQYPIAFVTLRRLCNEAALLVPDADRFSAILNTYDKPLVVYDKDDRVLLWNLAFSLAVGGRSDCVVMGMSRQCVARLAADAGAKADLVKVLLGQANSVRLDCKTYDLQTSTTSTGDTLVMFVDQTKLVSQGERLSTERSRLVAALNANDAPIVIYGKDMRIISWNTAYAVFSKYDPEANLEGVHLQDLLTHAVKHGRYPQAIGREKEWIASILSSAHQSQTSVYTPVDGDQHFRLSRSRTPNGDYIAMFTDITEFVQQKTAAEQAQSRLIAALNAYPAPFAIYDANNQLVVWNTAYRESMTSRLDGLFVGMKAEAAIEQAFAENKILDKVNLKRSWIEPLADKNTRMVEVEDMELQGDRHHRLHRTRANNGDTMLLRIDTTELVRQRRKLEVVQQRMFAAINAYPDPFAIYDKNHRIMIWNPAYAQSMGCQPDMVRVGTHLRTLLRITAYSGKMRAAIGREEDWVSETYHPDVLEPGVVDLEFSDKVNYRIVRSRTEDGEYVVIRINISEVVKKRREVEEYAKRLEDANDEITFMALHDELTGLGNRRFLTRKLDEFVERRKAFGGEIAALHVDLDRFKQINDTMGHAAGDMVLKHAAGMISTKLDAQDVVARTGGDEFVVLLYLSQPSDRPEVLAKGIIDDFGRPIRVEGREFRSGASIGIARTPLTDEQELLTNSDIALYNAKNAGRGQFRTFNGRDLEALRYNKVLSDELLRGLERWEFIPYFQPQVNPVTSEIVGVEALVRWMHPQRGLLTPEQFLPVATELNVVAEIDRQIFEQAIELCQWHFGGYQCPPTIAFNVSGQRVMTADLSEIEALSKRYAGPVAFELLETVFLEEVDHAFMEQLQKFRDLGISIEIDDFGSGRASVVALQRIGPDRIKIDRRLVDPMLNSEGGLQLVQSIIDMGHAMNIGITAEGVESRAHAEKLAGMGCDRLQGFFYSKPTGQLEDLVSDRSRAGRLA